MEPVLSLESCAKCVPLLEVLLKLRNANLQFQTNVEEISLLVKDRQAKEKENQELLSEQKKTNAENQELLSENKKMRNDIKRIRDQNFQHLQDIELLKTENRELRAQITICRDRKEQGTQIDTFPKHATTQTKVATKVARILTDKFPLFPVPDIPSKEAVSSSLPEDTGKRRSPVKRIAKRKKLELLCENGDLEYSYGSGKAGSCAKCGTSFRGSIELCLYCYHYPDYENFLDIKDTLSRNPSEYLTDGVFKRPISPRPEPDLKKLSKTSPPFEHPSSAYSRSVEPSEYCGLNGAVDLSLAPENIPESSVDLNDAKDLPSDCVAHNQLLLRATTVTNHINANFADVAPVMFAGPIQDLNLHFFSDSLNSRTMEDDLDVFFQSAKECVLISDCPEFDSGDDAEMTALTAEVDLILSELRCFRDAPLSPLSEISEEEDTGFEEDADFISRSAADVEMADDPEITHILRRWRFEFGADMRPLSPLSEPDDCSAD
ncbi:uncharacterized protein LOC129591720 [Paramacrobiotus metropolitanus]|uniref:uncharacterized protein LOC129591720 n=1 Tax=Paramacrobiotus metropolitanus TaxID=2943436 RepID=UPI00244655AE|nr:uncharacterized protein LOC129591720 [Paramacrobiotus metropolitanus]